MKIEKNKHDHSLTKLLKVCIFAMLMIAPLFASISQWCYATFNKNAKDSYYGETINQEERKQVTNQEQLNNIDTYYIDTSFLDYDYSTDYNFSLYVTNFKLENNGNLTSTEINNFTEHNIYRLIFGTSTNRDYRNLFVYYLNDNNESTWLMAVNLNNKYFVGSFKLTRITSSNNQFNNTWLYTVRYNKDSYLDNSFYYGVNQMAENPLFNWTQNTALYSGIKAMTDNLQVQTNVIAILVTYWTILTIIYIIIDIVLALFTKLSHLIVRSD